MAKIGEEPDIPSFARHLSVIVAELHNPAANLQEISTLVLRDHTLSLQVVRAANSAIYNRSGRSLQDIRQAMMMLGSRVVRELAAGIVFFEQYSRRSPAVRDVLLRSTLTGAHARELAVRAGLERAGVAYLCGLFHNLGELLVAAYCPREYDEIVATLNGEPLRDRYVIRSMIGCDYEELGMAVGRTWNLPGEVIAAMRATGERREPQLRQIVTMAHELTRATCASNSVETTRRIDEVNRRFGPYLRLSRRDITESMKAAAEDTRALFACAGVPHDTLAPVRANVVTLGANTA